LKRILITGVNSYIGTSFKNWLMQWPDEYTVETVDTISDEWKKKSFSSYDVILHVAGIVHKKEKPEMEKLYYDVNCDLAVAVAKKAKLDGVAQFIFMSTKGVYTPNTPVITAKTEPKPVKLYGRSKLMAEKEISKLISDNFTVSILRPPTVYGRNCSGNYVKLSKLARHLLVFPYVNSQRSMIYITNLCEFIKIIIDCNYAGVFFPQNREYVCTSEMVRCISKAQNRNIVLSKLLGKIVILLMKRIGKLRTMFSDSVYDKSLSSLGSFEYCKIGFEESISEAEGH